MTQKRLNGYVKTLLIAMEGTPEVVKSIINIRTPNTSDDRKTTIGHRSILAVKRKADQFYGSQPEPSKGAKLASEEVSCNKDWKPLTTICSTNGCLQALHPIKVVAHILVD